MRRLFVFRPEAAARQTLEKARALDMDAVSIPLFELEPLDWSPPAPAEFDGLLLTSANTVKMAGDKIDIYRALPVHAVGEGTAVAARVAGLGVATVGDGGIDNLLAHFDSDLRLLHLCGEDRREPSQAGRMITTIPIYRANERRGVAGLDGLTGQVAVVHSPRAARRLAELIDPALRSSIRIAAISKATAAAAGEGWEEVRAASAPTDNDLLALCVRLCET
jgi:uroporphyrinogen-III synthase